MIIRRIQINTPKPAEDMRFKPQPIPCAHEEKLQEIELKKKIIENKKALEKGIIKYPNKLFFLKLLRAFLAEIKKKIAVTNNKRKLFSSLTKIKYSGKSNINDFI